MSADHFALVQPPAGPPDLVPAVDPLTARSARFSDLGLDRAAAQRLAGQAARRDAEADDRHLCLECQHLSGYAGGSWRCGNWRRAGVALRERDAQLASDLVHLLQRCHGFKMATA